MTKLFGRLFCKSLLAWIGCVILTGVCMAEPYETLINNGSSQNRLDIAILGDGYTTEEMKRFRQDAHSIVQAIFVQEPYQEYQRYYNVHRIDVVSNQSGADHSNRVPPVYVDTAFDSYYNCFNIQRLICLNDTKVNQVIARTLSAGQFDVVLVLVNDPEYGGSGMGMAVVSSFANNGPAEVILHEVGHTFALLADEYAGGGVDCFPMLDPSDPNISGRVLRHEIKWAYWTDLDTPLPTPYLIDSIPGIYTGARYCNEGLYRPTYDSKMRSLGKPFDQINTEQHILRIYNTVSPIESVSPASNSITIAAHEKKTFTVSTLRPMSHKLQIQWFLDGQQVGAGRPSYVLNRLRLSAGMHTLQVTVSDPTSFDPGSMVRIDPNQVMKETFSWLINIQPE